MDNLISRADWHELANDLAWLEEHCRRQADSHAEAHQLQLAASLVRNVIGPTLEGQSPQPLHVAVVGGAGSGKSTIANFLMGINAAEANPQAGFTRHPVAYNQGNRGWSPPRTPGYLGKLRLLSRPAASNLDEDVYQIRPVADQGRGILTQAIVWDCPDMTTWAASGYISRLIEICGLADLLVYVASDERYNDEIPTRFLRLLLTAHKNVVVCLTKVSRAEQDELAAHFDRQVLAPMPRRPDALVTIPQLTPEQLADPWAKAAEYQQALVHTVKRMLVPPEAVRQRHVEQAIEFLHANQQSLLSVAKLDIAALEQWAALVRQGRKTFDDRYRREYLQLERFPRFDEAMIRLIDLIELPGVGTIVSKTLWVLRLPYFGLKRAWQTMMGTPLTPVPPEKPAMEAGLAGWLDFLRSETLRRRDQHPLWLEIGKLFEQGVPQQAQKLFDERFREFQLDVARDVDQACRAIYSELEKDPAKLNVLRGGRLALDLGAITTALVSGGVNFWDFALVPLAASISQFLVEFFGKQYIEAEREGMRQRQDTLAQKHISEPMQQWLEQRPTTCESQYALLQRILQNVPLRIQQLQQAIKSSGSV